MATTRPARTPAFYQNVASSLESEGFPDRKIIRTFLAEKQEDAVEVLLIAHGRYAETIFVDANGVLIHGPVPGFGCINT